MLRCKNELTWELNRYGLMMTTTTTRTTTMTKTHFKSFLSYEVVSFGAQPPSNLNGGTVYGLSIIWHNHKNFHTELRHLRLFFSKTDIEISGGSKKNWTDRD